MNFENTLNVDGKVISSENIQSTSRIVPIIPGSTTLPDITIDWNLSNTHILDMSNMNLSGGSTNIYVNLVNGSASNINQRLVIVQNNVAPPNHVNIALRAFDTESLLVAQTVADVTEIQNIINVAGRTTVLEFNFHNSVFRTISTKYSENTEYLSNNVIVNGENYNASLSKLDDIIGKLKPADAPFLDTLPSTALTFDVSTPNKTGWKVLTTGDNAENLVFVDPIIKLPSFKFENSGSTVATVDSIIKGEITNNTFDYLLPHTKSNLAMSLTKKVFNPFSNALDLTLQLQGGNAITPKGTYQTVNIASASRVNNFQLFRGVQPTMSTAPTYVNLNCASIPTSNFVCGIPVLKATDVLTATVKFKDISYINSGDGVYGSSVGKLSSSIVAQVTVPSDTPANMLANAPHSPNTVTNLTILSNVFSIDSSVTATNFITEIGVNGASAVFNRPTNPIVTDSITNKTLFGIDHTQPLTNAVNINKPLVLGGIVQYPKLDYSNVWNGTAPQGGLDYTTISNDRYIEFIVTMNQYSRLKIDFVSQTGFTNAAIEANPGFEISLKRADKLTENYNGNFAYSGVGVVANNAGCLDVADSTQSTKMLTFGEVVSTTATIRITLKNTSNHKFGQNITITPML